MYNLYMKKLLIPIIITNALVLSADDNINNVLFLDSVINNTKEYRKYIHETLVTSSSNIDNYFFEEKNKNHLEYNDTYGFLELSLTKNQHESLSLDQKISVKLKLPKIKENVKLIFESDDERDSKDFIENDKKNNDFNLALGYEELLKYDIDFQTKAGLKLHSGLDPFIKVEAKKIWENIYGLDYKVSQALKESVDKKLENTTYFKISKQLSDNLFLHNYNEYYWQSENRRDSEFYHTIYLNEKLSNQNHLTYQIDTNINNIDSNMKIKRYSGKLKFRHYIKDWLYTDVIPENYYREEVNFKSEFGIRFNLGMYFNKKSY